MDTLDIFLVDDDPTVREGIKVLLYGQPGIHIAGEASCGADLWHLLSITIPDVILMDVMLPGPDGIELTKKVRSRFPGIKVIVFTFIESSSLPERAVKAGANAILSKSATLSKLLSTIRGVADNKQMINPKLIN